MPNMEIQVFEMKQSAELRALVVNPTRCAVIVTTPAELDRALKLAYLDGASDAIGHVRKLRDEVEAGS